MFGQLIKLSIIFSLGILFFKTMELDVVKHTYFKSLANNNQVFESPILGPRGTIFDRKGRVLAESLYHYFKKQDNTVVYEGTDTYQGLKFEEAGVSYELRRKYPYGLATAFLTGYVARPQDQEVNNVSCPKHLNPRSLVGKTGLEAWFDCQLRGLDGNRLVEVNAKGKFVRDLGRLAPTAGEDLKLSIDAYYQQKAFEMLSDFRAVMVVSEVKTGKILVMASNPAYDPNDFSYVVDNQKINDYLKDEFNKPLLNRAIAARYHPGSVFKIAVASAGLAENIVSANTTFLDTGSLKVGEYEYRNWLWTKKGGTDGLVDMYKGLQRSNDIYFYKLGELLGPERMKKWAILYGVGQKTGIELPGEIEGIMPDPKWKEEKKNEKWFLGNTYHMAIGQGDVDVTPLQINNMTQAVANDGIRCKPSLLLGKDTECSQLPISHEKIAVIREGMTRACAPGGTAWPLFNFKTKLACKTGTAQVGDGSPDTHAWLTAFAPADDPQIAVTVMVERGGEGSDVAAPIVGDFLKLWLGEPETKVPRKIDGKVISE